MDNEKLCKSNTYRSVPMSLHNPHCSTFQVNLALIFNTWIELYPTQRTFKNLHCCVLFIFPVSIFLCVLLVWWWRIHNWFPVNSVTNPGRESRLMDVPRITFKIWQKQKWGLELLELKHINVKYIIYKICNLFSRRNRSWMKYGF